MSPGKPLGSMLFYDFCWNCCWLLLTVFYRLRTWGGENVPLTGPFLLVVNHQSHLDPIVAGMAVRPRHLSFMAKSGLFSNKFFGWLIGNLNSVSLKQGAADTAAIRAAIEQLEAGRAMLIFPEGTRTGDGAMHPFKKGAWVILSRAKCPVLPVAVEGCFDAWRRGQGTPKLIGQRVAALVGKPIDPEFLLAMGPERGLKYLQATIETQRLELVAKLAASGHRVTTKPPSDVEELA